jgi:hypothetical protein
MKMACERKSGISTQASVQVGTDAGKRADRCRVPDIHVDVINAPLAGALDDDVEQGPLASRKSALSPCDNRQALAGE